MKNYAFLIILSTALNLCACTAKVQESKNPNIIYVLADDMGYGDVSILNEKGKIPTPNLDRMASDGIRFTDAHTSSAVCTPTRYGIMTGRYNWRTRLKKGVLSGTSKALIPGSRSTVASMLQNHGYHTAFIGKWHLGWDWALKDPEGGINADNIDYSKPVKNGPNVLGFDYAYGHCGSLDMTPYVYVENGMPTAIPDTITVNEDRYGFWREGPTSPDFVHDDVTPNFFRRSFEYIRNRTEKEIPFFLYLALPSPHTPILPTEEWQGKSGINPYADFVMEIDAYMGQLEAVIREAGIEENTMVIFTCDNGCSGRANFSVLAEKGHHPSYIYRGSKADIFEGGHRVPFIVKWPQEIDKGIVSDQTICTTDLMATCAEIVGYSLLDNEGEDSYSLVPAFKQVKSNEPIREATIHHSINGSFAIRKGDWKLIMCPGSGGWSYPKPNDQEAIDSLPAYQLYNLKCDPGETRNLYAPEKERVKELRSLLVEQIIEGRSTPGAVQENDPINGEWTQIEFIHP